MTHELNESDLLEQLASDGWTMGLTDLSTEMQQHIIRIMGPLLPESAAPGFFASIGFALPVYAASVEARHRSRGPGNRPRKISTVLAGKLEALRPCVESSMAALETLPFASDPAASDQQTVSFWQAWRLADDRVALLERFATAAVGLPAPAELTLFIQEWATVARALGALSVEERVWLGEDFRAPPGIDAHDCVRDPSIALGTVMLYLGQLRGRLADLAIETKRGRDQAPERQLVRTLANIYEEFTGQRPTRRFESGDLKGSDALGEYGPFLELTRLLAAHVYASLSEAGIEQPSSLSFARLIREELTFRTTRRDVN